MTPRGGQASRVKEDAVFDSVEDLLSNEDPSESYEQITTIFDTGTVKEALQKCDREGKRVVFNCLTILLSLLLPSLSSHLQTLTSTPLASFTSSESLLSYMDNIIKYGVAAQLTRGLIHTVGNTGCGKSSLVNTLKKCLENPHQDPTPVLSQDNNHLKETQVLEVYSDVSFQHDDILKLLKRDRLFSIEKQPSTIEKERRRYSRPVKMNIFDLGGHTVSLKTQNVSDRAPNQIYAASI